MIACAKQRGPCSGKGAPKATVCIPPPPPPFPWIYPIIIGAIITFVGAFYRFYLWREQNIKAFEGPIWRPRAKVKTPVHDEDLPPCVQYLIVGAGAAGWAAYKAIMQHDENARVFFISKEDAYPYKRPPMSKFMWWNGEPPEMRTLNYVKQDKRMTMYYTPCKTFMDVVKFYRKKEGPAVSIAMGWCVLRVDPEEHRVWVKTYCGERPIYYERALLAVGAKANNLSFYKSSPKFVRDRITPIRTIRDLENAYRKVVEAKHVTIIGAGYLGSELAWFMGRMREHWFPKAPEEYVPPQVLHIYKSPGILSGVIPQYLGEWAAEKLKCMNVSLMPNTQVYDAFESKDGRLQLTLSNGKSVVTDFVIVAIGAKPREEVAVRSNLELDPINGGYKVNTELMARTHLYVAGDAASLYSQWKDHRLRMDSFLSAEEQGFIAGANMAGYWIPCNMEPHFWFMLPGDIEMEVIGEVSGCMTTVGLFKPCDEIEDEAGRKHEEEIGEFERPCYKESESYRNRYKRGMLFYLRENIVVGMAFWNFPPIEDRYEVVTEMLRAKPTYEDINMLAEQLGFPDIKCVYIPDRTHLELPCIYKDKSNWMEYEDFEKQGVLSKVETPETVLYKNSPLELLP